MILPIYFDNKLGVRRYVFDISPPCPKMREPFGKQTVNTILYSFLET